MKLFNLFLLTAAVASAQIAPPRVPDGVRAHRDLVYVEDGHERHKLDLFVPEKANSPLPLIIWVHGGGWQNGSKDGCPPLRGGYTERGYAVASINYRLSGHAVFPAQIEDCKAAIRWLRAHAKEYSLDPQRFGVWGSSAGGHLVALLGTSGDVKDFDVGANLDQSSRVQAVCDYFGPTDLTAFVTTPGYESHASDASPEAKLIGGAVLQNKDKAARANPIAYVTKDDPPFLIVHGDEDRTVPLNQSQLLFQALEKEGVSAHFHTIQGAGHGNGFGGPEIEPMVRAFFDSRLKSSTLPSHLGGTKTSESAASVAPAARSERHGRPPGDRPRLTWEQVRTRAGVAGDGRIPRDQFKGPAPIFERLDRNHDGALSQEDFTDTPSPAAPQKSSRRTRDPSGVILLDGERWTYRDGDFEMSGILVKPASKGPFPAVLISHGLGGNAQSFGLNKAREMVKWGLVCMTPTYTHTGRDADRSTVGASPENLRRARVCLDLLRGMPEVDGKRIAAYGHSMGGFVTIGIAATASDVIKAAAITGSGISPLSGFPAPSAEEAGKVRVPFLILHGSTDTTVRPEQSAALKQTLDANHVVNDRHVFEGEGHPIDQTQREEVFRRVREWFIKQGVLND